MNEFHFLRPFFLYLLIPLALLFLWLQNRRKANVWDKICSKDLLPFMIVKKTRENTFLNLALFTLFSFLVISLAGPAWKEGFEPVFKRPQALVIALDLSDIMNAEDVKPSRLKRAIYKINDILERQAKGQTALVVFSADSFVVTPLTDDIETMKSQLLALDSSIMPTKGHAVSKAIQKASDLLKQGGNSNGSILLMTSQLSDQDLEKSLELVKLENLKLSILGIGGEGVTPIQKPEGGFLKDKKGAMLTTKLPVENLKKLAKAAKGIYQTMTLDERDVELLVKQFSEDHVGKAKEQTDKQIKKWQDEGYLFVLAALPFISLLFRRGILLPIFLGLSLFSEAAPQAQAETLFIAGEFAEAKELFENEDWKACAHYRLEEYEAAAQLFEKNPSADGLYNLGTTRAKLQDFEKALQAYQEGLKIDPDHEDMLYNKKIIEDFLKQQNEAQDKNQDNQKKNQDQNDKEDNSQKEKSEENSEEGDQQKEKQKNEAGEDKQKESGKQDRDPNKSQESDSDQPENNQEDKEKDQAEEESNLEVEKEDTKEEDDQKKRDERQLLRIKDDPGGLLRRKFLYQYQGRQK